MRINWQDVTGGVVLCLFGAAAAFMAAELETGTARNMGPGYFPMMASVVIILCGVVIGGVGLFSVPTRLSRPDWGPLGSVIVAGTAFAVLMPAAGLLPAVAATLVLPGLFDRRITIRSLLLLTFGLCLAAWLIFIFALGLPIAAWKLPAWI